MPLHSWLVPALLLEIALVLFAPPIATGSRSLFLSDLWFFAWMPLALVQVFRALPKEERKSLAIQLGASALVISLAFLHGSVRPSLGPRMRQILNFPPDDTFQFFRELVIAARFVSWFWAGLLVSRLPWILTREQLDQAIQATQRALAASILFAVAVMIAVKALPPLAGTLGRIYGYDPTVVNWADRIFGTFRSPIEGSLTFGLSLFLLIPGSWAPRGFRIFTLLAAVLGIVLTKSITSLVAAGAVAALVAGLAFERKLRLGASLRYAFPAVSGCLAAATFWWGSDHPFIASKLANLSYRIKPWAIFWDAAVSRWDLFLFGQGFGPHFTDNSFVFLFSRGGLLLLVPGLLLLGRALRKTGLSSPSGAALLYFVVTSLTVDSLILRPIVAIWICVGLLQFKRDSEPFSFRGFLG